MKKRAFESTLFLRKIQPDDKDFWYYVIAECLFQLNSKNIKDCECMIHKEQREKLKKTLDKAIDIRNAAFRKKNGWE